MMHLDHCTWVWEICFQLKHLEQIPQFFVWYHKDKLTLNVPCISESCVEVKIKFLFWHFSVMPQKVLWRPFIKPFEAPQRSVKIKLWFFLEIVINPLKQRFTIGSEQCSAFRYLELNIRQNLFFFESISFFIIFIIFIVIVIVVMIIVIIVTICIVIISIINILVLFILILIFPLVAKVSSGTLTETRA